jgi:hypothetical protein
MELLAEWLPRVGASLLILIGLVGFFTPRTLLDPMGIKLESNEAISEVRGVFGGLNIGTGTAALYFADPTVFTALGFTWLCVTAARPYSMFADGTTLKQSIAPICVDLTVALLLLSQCLLR